MADRKVILICIGGLILNLIGSVIAGVFNLSVYLDTIGTIFIAALGGYVPGIVVAFCTSLIKTPFYTNQMYYAFVGMLVAIMTTFFARRGLYDRLTIVLMFIPVMTLVTGTFDLIIENFLNSTSVLQSVNQLKLNYVDNFLNEFLDKGLSILVAFLLFRSTSWKTREAFRMFGQKQAPISIEMEEKIHKQKYKKSSLPTKLLLIVLFSALFVSLSISTISYLLFRSGVTDDRIKTVDGINTIILNEINPYMVDEYIRLGRNSKEYRDIEDRFYGIKNSNPDIRYIYVYKIEEDGCHVVFDLNTIREPGDKPGVIAPFDKNLTQSDINDLLAGRPLRPIISDDEYGYLLTLYKPLYDSSGKCRCYTVVDYSMEILNDYTRTFIIKLIALFAGCFVFILTLSMAFIENHIILPVNTMAYCAENFSYDSLEARKEHIERIEGLQIKTGDEIENLYRALLSTMENVVDYLQQVQQANMEVHQTKMEMADLQVKKAAIERIAHNDSLTGVKNKTSYVETIEELNKVIEENGNPQFCIVMIDVNFLKRVNDTYGHERGNEYLINACRLVCSVFGEEHVYRIGGDEFVVIVEGEKVSLCKYFIGQFNAEMGRKNANDLLEPWEKVSAAVGVAFYEPNVDKTADDVFNRADKEMYENKLAMKAQRTD